MRRAHIVPGNNAKTSFPDGAGPAVARLVLWILVKGVRLFGQIIDERPRGRSVCIHPMSLHAVLNAPPGLFPLFGRSIILDLKITPQIPINRRLVAICFYPHEFLARVSTRYAAFFICQLAIASFLRSFGLPSMYTAKTR